MTLPSIEITSGNHRGSGMAASEFLVQKLVTDIAKHHDREAFSELFRRFERPAFSLARYITRDPQMAEEAVQEAFLYIWRSAHTFRATGKVRSWILRIVAGRSFKVLNRKRRNREQMERLQRYTLQQTDISQEPCTEQGELLAALRQQLECLPELDRHLIALYYGGELSQDEIAQQLEVPQRTVSYRIQKVLEHLRDRLVDAGYAATLPLASGSLSSDLVTEAICNGFKGPPGLFETLSARLSDAAADASQRAALVKGGLSPLIWSVGAIAILAVGIGAYAWMQQDPPAKTPSGDKADQTDSKSKIELETTPLKERLNASWSFKDGPSKELPVVQGTWKWHIAPDGKGEMQVESRTSSDDERRDIVLVLPNRIPSKPIRIDARVRLVGEDRYGMDLLWLTDEGLPSYIRHNTLYQATQNWNDLKVYVIDKWIVYYMNDQPHVVCQYERAYPGEHLSIIFTNFNVREIKIRELAPDDPDLIRLDPESLVKKLKIGNPGFSQKTVPSRTGGWLKVLDVDH